MKRHFKLSRSLRVIVDGVDLQRTVSMAVVRLLAVGFQRKMSCVGTLVRLQWASYVGKCVNKNMQVLGAKRKEEFGGN